MPRRWESYQVTNRVKQVHHLIQVLLLVTFILGINHLAMEHFLRFDLTENHKYALSPETRAYLKDLRQPVRVIVTIPADSPRVEEQVLYRYISQLLQEYAYQSRKDGSFRILTEYVDIYTNLNRAEVLSREYGLDQANAVLIVSGDRKRLLRAEELVDFENREPVTFKGEAALTSAIVEVTQNRTPRIYFLQGHEETAPDDPSPATGLSAISRELQLRNFSLMPLDLTAVQGVPEDAAIVVIADPKGPLLPSETDKLRTYLTERAGRVLVWMRPGVRSGMESLLAEWGILLPEMRLVERDPNFRESGSAILIRNYGEHPVTQSLIKNQTSLLLGTARPVLPRPADPPDERLERIPLFASSSSSWGESLTDVANPSFDPTTDYGGPVPLAVAAQRRASSRLGIEVPGGRVVVVGSPDLFTNQRINALGNVSLFFNILNWMLDRNQMLVIPPRPIETYQFVISDAEFKRLVLLFLLLPGSVALFGTGIYWIRKS